MQPRTSDYTQWHTQSVGILWTRDRPVAETSTWQHTAHKTDTHATDGVQTRNPNKQANADPRPKMCGRKYRTTKNYNYPSRQTLRSSVSWRGAVWLAENLASSSSSSTVQMETAGYFEELVMMYQRARRSEDRISVGAWFSAQVQTGPGAQPTTYTTGTGSFVEVKRSERGVDHPPHLAPRLKKE